MSERYELELFYALLDLPESTPERPSGLARYLRGENELIVSYIDGDGNWIDDGELLGPIWGIEDGGGVAQISKEQARALLDCWGHTTSLYAPSRVPGTDEDAASLCEQYEPIDFMAPAT